MSTMLSKNISLEEAISSQAATRLKINNKPSAEIQNKLKITAEKVIQKVRDHFGQPIRISSGYRSPKVNKAVGGSKTSQHMTGEAYDIQGTNGITNAQIFEYIKQNLLFDQLIWEFGTTKNPAWVHVSYREGRNRKQVLIIK